MVACGKSGDPGPDEDRKGDTDGRKAGVVRVAFAAFPDSLDPAVAYGDASWSVVWTVHTPLLTYRHAEGLDGAEVVPGLADGLPNVSRDGRTYRLRLREGLRYSDGTTVKASDFEHAVKRVLRLNPQAAGYFLGIAGAPAYAEADQDAGDVSGITADDRKRQITVKLLQPDGRFPNILAMTFAAPVPGDTPFRNLTRSPPPGVGPFRVAAVDPGRTLRLQHVPRFSVGDIPEAKVDRIDVRVIESRSRLTRRTQRNLIDVQVDPPAAGQLRDIRERFDGKRYRELATRSTYFFSLNEETPPFDDVRMRRAASIATDQTAVSRLYGDLLEPSCTFLPPGTPGYRKPDPCPWGDPKARSDLDRARALVRAAGKVGDAVTVYGSDQPQRKAAAGYFAKVLTQIGLKARTRIVEDSQYVETITNRDLEVQSAIVDWQGDLPHPGVFFPLVDGRAIGAGLNAGYVDDPVINRALGRADGIALARAEDVYAAVERRVVARAHVVTLGHRRRSLFLSERMSFDDECTVVHPVYGPDLTSLCLK